MDEHEVIENEWIAGARKEQANFAHEVQHGRVSRRYAVCGCEITPAAQEQIERLYADNQKMLFELADHRRLLRAAARYLTWVTPPDETLADGADLAELRAAVTEVTHRWNA